MNQAETLSEEMSPGGNRSLNELRTRVMQRVR